jgi:two-component system cell cycle response regulator
MNNVPSVFSFGSEYHSADEDGSQSLQKGVDILLVDDSQETLEALEALLSAPDRNVVKVASGQEALRYLLTHDVGLILLDVKMAA